MHLSLSTVLKCICVACSGAMVHAAVVSVNFNGSATEANYTSPGNVGPSVTTTAGAVPANFFANAPGNSGTINALKEDTGGANAVVTAISVTYSASNVYNAYADGNQPTGNGNGALMQGYLDNFSGAASITVSGLGSEFTTGGYEVLVYQNTDSAGSFGFSATDTAAHTSFAYGEQTSSTKGGNYPLSGTDGFTGSTSTDPAGPGTAANYVILTGLSGSGFTLTGLTGTTGDGRPRIDGFQIVSTPEPASLGLLALGAVRLLARRRRSV